MPNPLQSLFEGVEGVDQTIIEHLTPIFEARVDERVKEVLEAQKYTVYDKEAKKIIKPNLTRNAAKKLADEKGLDFGSSEFVHDLINEQFETQLANLQESLDEVTSYNINEANAQFAKKLDVFLETVTVDWANRNSVALQESALVDAAGNFFTHMNEAAVAMNATLPEKDFEEEKQKLIQQNESYRARLNDTLQQVSTLSESVVQMQREQIIESVSVGMSSFGKQSLAEKCSTVNFTNPEEFKNLVEGYKIIIEKDDGESEDEDDIVVKEGKYKGKMKEGEKLPQTPEELNKKAKKDKVPMNESYNGRGIDMSLFL